MSTLKQFHSAESELKEKTFITIQQAVNNTNAFHVEQLFTRDYIVILCQL